MKILHLSDTHGKHRDLSVLPDADVIVHSGDFTMHGSEAEAYDFMDWFCGLSYRYKLFIAGNHDSCMYGAQAVEGLPAGVHYICGSGVSVGGLLFYGVPMFMQDCIDGRYDRLLAEIPAGVDVLVTHSPSLGVFDGSEPGVAASGCGDALLWRRVIELKPQCHLFGHYHGTCGVGVFCGTTFSNAAVLDNDYRLVRGPNLIVI